VFRTIALVFLLAIAAAFFGCGSSNAVDGDDALGGASSATRRKEPQSLSFPDADATAVSDGFAIYWLGESVTMSGGTLFVSLPSDVSPPRTGAFQFEYVASSMNDAPTSTMLLTDYRSDVWLKVATPRSPTRHVSLDGHEADVFLDYGVDGTLGHVTVVTTRDSTTIVAEINIPPSDRQGTAQPNPDKVMLETLQQLRRYP
jgi:hypothetical protein